MRSKTSCFNRTAFAKNFTRFAPVLALDTLLLLLMVLMKWSEAGNELAPQYYFMYRLNDIFEWSAVINMAYACLMAQLLFGDLYNTRMCNALHAMPLRRETWFVTNALSGLVYSLIPTAVASLVLLPMLMSTVFDGAWKIALWYFVAANVEFICLFGIALFCTMMVGSRFTMVAGYGLVNFGSGILYWLVNTVYTPMLYGILTPTTLASKLMPLTYMVDIRPSFDHNRKLLDKFGKLLPGVRSSYEMLGLENLPMLALVGIVFAIAALILYRHRNLECAGDAVFSKNLEPVFQVLSALFVAVAAEFVATGFLGMGRDQNHLEFVFLFAGLLVGWFAGKMLVERSARVFSPKNWIGLGILAVVLAATMGLNKLDVLGIEERMPNAGDVACVTLDSYEMDDPADIEKVMKFHTLALADRVEESGAYVQENGKYVLMRDSSYRYWQEGDPVPQQRMASHHYLTYTLKDGREVRRGYNVWVDSAAGEIPQKLLSRWDAVNNQKIRLGSKDVEILPMVLGSYKEMYCSQMVDKCPEALKNRAAAEGLLRAIQADCEAGNMAQDRAYHSGVFSIPQQDGEIYEDRSLWVSLTGEENSWDINVYPECENTLRWLRENGLLPESVTILPKGSTPRY